MKNFIQIARILRPHGIKGALKISPTISDIPFSKFSSILVGDDKELMHVKRVQPLNQFLLLQIEEITSCEHAEFYRNQCIYADRDFYPELLKDVVMMSDYIGCEVVDENGQRVGVVVDANDYGSAEIITINCGGVSYQVPFISDTLKFDKKAEKFIIDSKRFLEVRV